MKKQDLLAFFVDGCKEKTKWMIGTEHEKFGFKTKDLKPINFQDIEQIFLKLSQKYNWKRIYENKGLIALTKGMSSITLEPGGQIELSGAPLPNLFETCKEVHLHQNELSKICKEMEIDFMGMGVLPKWRRQELNFVPKERYKIMSSYMPKVGPKGLDMMLRTSTIQANYDFSSEKDMVKKFRVSQSLQPVIIALYANSPFIDGKLTDYLSYRSHIWTKTDANRCGLLPFIYDDSFGFERYVDYLLNVPMYFVIRNGKYIDLTGIYFKDFMEGKIKKEMNLIPSFTDWKLHITTVFPEVRLKNFIELRAADGGPWSRVCALPAFWTGILYDEEILDDVWNLVKHWKFKEINEFYENVRLDGLGARTPDLENLKVFCKKIIKLSSKGLKKRNIIFDGKNESFFLKPLKKILNSGKSPAAVWKKLFLEQWDNNVDMLYKTNYFKALKLNEEI